MYSTEFEQAWSLYPRKIGKALAFKKFNIALRSTDFGTIISGIEKYAATVTNTDKQYIKHLSTFLNQQCYLDEYEPDEGNVKASGSGNNNRTSQISMAMDVAVKKVQKENQKTPVVTGWEYNAMDVPF